MNKLSEKELYAILKKFDSKYKPEIIRINISTTFLVRARCSKCGGYPYYYYWVANPILLKDIRNYLVISKWFRSLFKRMTYDWYLSFAPKYFHDIKDFSIILEDKKYNPALHKIRNITTKDNENILEFIGCHCGDTVWAFNDKSNKNRPEIINRKGRYKYPHGFEH